MVKVKENLVGKKFNKLTVIKQVDDYISPNGVKYSRWLCECDCGNKKYVVGRDLKSGNTKSCGCLVKETSSKLLSNISKKYNTYDLSGEYGIGYTLKEEPFYFDLEDYDKIKFNCWWIDEYGYVVSYDTNNKIKAYMHRVITDCPDGFIPDHIHGESTRNDNRKCNLRIATHSQNMMNRKRQINNKSGIVGVVKDKNKWRAQICVNNKRITLGRFDNFEDAVKARKSAEDKYFGEFSYSNSIKKELEKIYK